MGVEIENLVVELGGKEILHSIDLTIGTGELFSLLGPSGCGKTTLLKTLSGLLIQDEGTVKVDGRCLDALPPEKRDVAVVFQELRLFPNMNVIDNVAFPLKMRGMKKAERHKRASEVLEQVQLGGFEKRRISQLSGGQQQRVALARGIAARPQVLLLDEPFSSLDENLRDDMRDLLATLHQQLDTTMILVTHDQYEALKLSDRIAIMEAGRVVQCDTPQKIYECPATIRIAEYFSDISKVEGRCESGVFTCPLFEASCDLKDGPAVAAVRQLALALDADPQRRRYEIKRIEYLGGRQKLAVERDGIVLVLEVDTDGSLRVGDEVGVSIDFEKLLFFSE